MCDYTLVVSYFQTFIEFLGSSPNLTNDEHFYIFFSTIVMSLSAILAIVFSISLVAIQNAANKYVPRVLKYYVNDKRIRGVYLLFFVSITFGVLSLGFDWGIGAYIGFLSLLMCLVCVYGQFNAVADFVNPIELIEKLKKEALEEKNDESRIEEIIVDLSDIALKSDSNILKNCISVLEDIGKKAETYKRIQRIFARLGFIGVNVARDSIKQTYSSNIISSLSNIATVNIKKGKLKNRELQWLIRGNIRQIKEVFEEIIQDKELNGITNAEIGWMLSSLYSFADATIGDISLEKQSNWILDLMRCVAFESEKIPRIEYGEILLEYKGHLRVLEDNESLSEDLKNKIEKMHEEATRKS